MRHERVEQVQDAERLAERLWDLKGAAVWDSLKDCLENDFTIPPHIWDLATWQRLMGRNPARPGSLPPRTHPAITGPWQALAVILMVAHCGSQRDDLDAFLAGVERALRCWIERPRPIALSNPPPDYASAMLSSIREGLAPKFGSRPRVREYIEEIWATPYA